MRARQMHRPDDVPDGENLPEGRRQEGCASKTGASDCGRILRDAQLKDLAAVVAIYNSTIAGRMATADTEPVSVEDRTEWFRAHSAHHRRQRHD